MNTVLSKDEQVLQEQSFSVSLIMFWFKARYTLTNKRITAERPNRLLGIIPFGKSQLAQPLKTVASVYSSTKFHLKRLLMGFITLIIGLFLMDNLLLAGIVFSVLGILNILSCYTATVVITNNSGQQEGYELAIFEKADAQAFVNQINNSIAEI